MKLQNQFLDDVIDEITGITQEKWEDIIGEERSFPLVFDYIQKLEDKYGTGIIGGNCEVGEYTLIEGTVITGENVRILPFAHLRGPIFLGDNCAISAETKNVVMLSGSKAVHRNIYLGDSIIGRDCNIAAGTCTANLRFDNENVSIRHEGEQYKTSRRKLGTIMEHNVKTGINSKLGPGSYLVEGSRKT